MAPARWKFCGWGIEGTGLDVAEQKRLLDFYHASFGAPEGEPRTVPQVAEIDLRRPRIGPPPALAAICTSEPYERLVHSGGKSFPETLRIFERDVRHPPDVVALPRSEADVVAVLDWAADADAAVVPFGGGSSVVGGVEPCVGDSFAGTISLDLKGLDQLLEVDRYQPGGADAGRHARSGDRGSAQAARSHPAPLSAELRVLDPRRLDCDPLGRPFRDALHPHRGFPREHAGDHAGGPDRDPAPAGLGRRAEPRSSLRRLGGGAGDHHRGVAAPAGPAAAPRHGLDRLWQPARSGAGGARDRTGRALPLQPARARPDGGQAQRCRRRQLCAPGAGLRVRRSPGRALARARPRALRRPWRPVRRRPGCTACTACGSGRGLAPGVHPHALRARAV